jgi:hypothetical protein
MMSKKLWKYQAELVRRKRLEKIVNGPGVKEEFSQFNVAQRLGYKNGQFISNTERGLCSLPMRNWIRVCELLDIDREEFKEAALKDYEKQVNDALCIIESPADELTNFLDKNMMLSESNNETVLQRL